MYRRRQGLADNKNALYIAVREKYDERDVAFRVLCERRKGGTPVTLVSDRSLAH
jgi:hypothetical protein